MTLFLIFMSIMLILLLAAMVLLLFSVFYEFIGLTAAPWVPTSSSNTKRFLKIAAIQRGQKFYDLGCGDGRIIIAAAKAGANAEGFEISPFPYLLSLLRLFFLRNNKIKIRYENFWGKNLGDADIVYFYLMPEAIPKLRLKLESELKKGTKIISFAWPINGWNPVGVDVIEGRLNFYLYQI